MAAGRAVTPKEKSDGERLHAYWVTGAGLARWASSPHPWATLHAFLSKYLHGRILDDTTSKWHYEVFHQHTGSDAYRLEHGGKIRGKKIGPG